MSKRVMARSMCVVVLVAALVAGCGDEGSEADQGSGLLDHVLGRGGGTEDEPDELSVSGRFCEVAADIDAAHQTLHAGGDLKPWGGLEGVAERARTLAQLSGGEALAEAASEVADGLAAVANGADMDDTFEAEPARTSAIELFETIGEECGDGAASARRSVAGTGRQFEAIIRSQASTRWVSS